MEKETYDMDDKELERFENKKQREKFILLVLTLYGIGMITVSLILMWPVYVTLLICIGLSGAWIMCILRYRDFRFRANVLALISLFDFTMYAVRAGSLFDLLTPMAAVAVLLGISALPEVLHWVNLDTLFLCLYHIFVLKTVPFVTPLDRCRASLILVSIALVEIVIYWMMKKQNDMLRQMQDIINELRRAENSKSDFLANVSHEIRTPVNAVCGISEIMLMEETSPPKKENIHDIQMAGRNLQRLINDLLDFTELQSGNFDLVEEPYNLSSTINDVMNMTDAQIDTKDIEFIIDCDARIPRSLVGDEQKIRRVMINILNNAVKFTREGCISLTVKYRVESYGINLIVKIRDTGIGIKKEKLEQIFTNFNQVDTRRNRQEGGAGLGLAISRALISKMNGFIRVESEWEKGTEVQFVIPQKIQEEQPMIEVMNPREKWILYYFNVEKYRYSMVRDSYARVLNNIGEQLKLACQPCRTLDELKRRIKKENYTHLFIGLEEYWEDPSFFERLAEKLPVFLAAERTAYEHDRKKMENSRTLHIFKPFYVLSVAAALNGEQMMQSGGYVNPVQFIAPSSSVLVVDDSLMNLKVVEGLLRPYQIQVFTAESGAEALEKIEREDFDFIFMDHMMPEMDGVETLHRIRKKRGNYYQKVPVVALTANAVGGAREMFLQEGFQDFVSKPIELPVLERVLRKYIPDHKKKKLIADKDPEIRKENLPQHLAHRDERQTEQKIEGLDRKLGIQYSGGSEEDYLDIVKIYCATGRKKIADIQRYFNEKDWNNYTILVHAVKSTSLGIGAENLSEHARLLEEAGKEEKVSYIAEHHAEMMEEYQNMMNEIEGKILHITGREQAENQIGADVGCSDTTRTELSEEQLDKLLKQLSEALASFDSDMVRPVLEELLHCKYPEIDIFKPVHAIADLVEAFDFMGAMEKLQQIKEEMR